VRGRRRPGWRPWRRRRESKGSVPWEFPL